MKEIFETLAYGVAMMAKLTLTLFIIMFAVLGAALGVSWVAQSETYTTVALSFVVFLLLVAVVLSIKAALDKILPDKSLSCEKRGQKLRQSRSADIEQDENGVEYIRIK